MEQSYMHVKWMKESDLEEYSYKAKQKIRRYWGQKEKKKFLVSLILDIPINNQESSWLSA
jgi:hypothetical protein